MGSDICYTATLSVTSVVTVVTVAELSGCCCTKVWCLAGNQVWWTWEVEDVFKKVPAGESYSKVYSLLIPPVFLISTMKSSSKLGEMLQSFLLCPQGINILVEWRTQNILGSGNLSSTWIIKNTKCGLYCV